MVSGDKYRFDENIFKLGITYRLIIDSEQVGFYTGGMSPSNIVLRLISETVLPALIVVVSKVVAVLILSAVFAIPWKLDPQSVFPSFVFGDESTTIFINSYSNLAMYAVTLLGFGWVILKSYHLHDTHVSPAFVLKLLALNLSRLLSDSKRLYTKGVVWMAYVWLITIFIAVHTIVNINYRWIFALVFIASLVASWYFIADVEKEIG